MTPRSLKCFLAVAEELNFGRAAAKLHISQPPLTMQIQNLESRLGVKLFDRNRRRVTLTPAGAALVVEARRILKQLDDAERVVRRAGSGDAGRIRIGYMSSAMLIGIGEAYAKVRKVMPGIIDTWTEMSSRDQIEALRNDQIDLGFALSPADLGDLRHQVLLQEPVVAVLPVSHPSAGARSIALSALKNDLFVMFPRDASARFHDSIIALCAEANFSPQIAHHANNFLTVVSAVAMGQGVALLPRWMQRFTVPGVAYKAIRGAKPIVHISMIWNPHNASPVLPRLISMLSDKPKLLDRLVVKP